MILAGAGIRYFSSGINRDRGYPFNHCSAASALLVGRPRRQPRADAVRGELRLRLALGAGREPGGRPGPRGRGARGLREADRLPLRRRLPPRGGERQLPAEARVGRGRASSGTQRYEYPKIILSHNAEFFAYIEKKYGDKLPVYRGSGGAYWEDGAGSSARETALCRNAHEAVANGEKLLALAERIGGQESTGRTRSTTSGATACSTTSTPGALLLGRQAGERLHQGPVEDQGPVRRRRGHGGERRLLEQGIDALASLVRTDGPALVVFNPTSWPRTDVVDVALPEGLGVAEPDVPSYGGGRTARSCRQGRARLRLSRAQAWSAGASRSRSRPPRAT